MSERKPALQAAFEAANYAVCVRGRRHRVRIGRRHPLLDRRLRGLGCEQHWQLITACNPRSERLTPAENAVRMRALDDELAVLGWRRLPACNDARDGGWLEPAYCLLDAPPATLLMLGQRYAQHAVVSARLDAAAHLVWMPATVRSGG